MFTSVQYLLSKVLGSGHVSKATQDDSSKLPANQPNLVANTIPLNELYFQLYRVTGDPDFLHSSAEVSNHVRKNDA